VDFTKNFGTLLFNDYKVKLSLCLIKHHPIKEYGEWGIAPRILKLDTRWRRVNSLTARSLCPRYHWVGGWVSPRDGLGAVVKRKNLPRTINTASPFKKKKKREREQEQEQVFIDLNFVGFRAVIGFHLQLDTRIAFLS
jgi:hypothetical protein